MHSECITERGSCHIVSSRSCRWGGYGIWSLVWKAILDVFPVPVLEYCTAHRAADSVVWFCSLYGSCANPFWLKALHQPLYGSLPWIITSTPVGYLCISGICSNFRQAIRLCSRLQDQLWTEELDSLRIVSNEKWLPQHWESWTKYWNCIYGIDWRGGTNELWTPL